MRQLGLGRPGQGDTENLSQSTERSSEQAVSLRYHLLLCFSAIHLLATVRSRELFGKNSAHRLDGLANCPRPWNFAGPPATRLSVSVSVSVSLSLCGQPVLVRRRYNVETNLDLGKVSRMRLF